MNMRDLMDQLPFKIIDRSDTPMLDVEDVRELALYLLSLKPKQLPFLAMVTGPDMHLHVHFHAYDADKHRGLVARLLMELIREGADHIILLSEVWLRGQEVTDWHGVAVQDCTEDGDIMHLAEFEGKHSVGPWKELEMTSEGNFCGLFEKSRRLN